MSSVQRLINISLRNKTLVFPNSALITKRYSGSAPNVDGGTYVTILNNEQHAPVMINSYSQMGFRLNNGLFVMGPVALFPQSVLCWNIEGDEDINERSLSLFLHLTPKLDVLVIGLSDARNQKLLLETRSYVHNLLRKFKPGEKMNIEVLPTEKAVTTFNFLNSEQRFVAAALVPPSHYTPSIDDEYRVAYLTKKKKEGDFIISEA